MTLNAVISPWWQQVCMSRRDSWGGCVCVCVGVYVCFLFLIPANRWISLFGRDPEARKYILQNKVWRIVNMYTFHTFGTYLVETQTNRNLWLFTHFSFSKEMSLSLSSGKGIQICTRDIPVMESLGCCGRPTVLTRDCGHSSSQTAAPFWD